MTAAHRAYLGLGSNIAPEDNLPRAVRALSRWGRVIAVSQTWETEPVGFVDQSNFLNAAVLLRTSLSPDELYTGPIATIERELGRVRNPDNKNAPRTIDVDVLLFDNEVLQIGARHIPDPDIAERAFLAQTLAEVDADYVHPELGRTLRQIADSLKSQAAGMRLRQDVDLRAAAGLANSR